MNENEMNIKKLYEMYGSNTSYHAQYKDYFEDKDGFANIKAYDDFARKISALDTDFYLACISIDLRYANSVNYAYGNYVLRKVVGGIKNSLKNCYIFRIQGDKFNIFIQADGFEEFKEYIDIERDYCNIYCGVVQEAYVYEKNYDLVQKGIKLMYQNRMEKNSAKSAKSNMISGNKSNTPVELQETETRKYRKTMWYATINLKVHTPEFKEVVLYVFPTKFAHSLESVPTLVAIDDFLEYRVEYGKNVEFGVMGNKFTLTTRFTRDGHLNISFFKENGSEDKEKNYEADIKIHEGECVPANFGKRVGKDEIYPIKQNIEGLCDYILFKNADMNDNHDPKVITSGIIKKDDVTYGVYMDNTFIDLIAENT